MTSRRKHLAATSFLVLVMKVFSGHTLTCDPSEYEIETECCPMCNPGSRVKTDCTEFRSTSCLPCTEGTFMNKPTGRRECFSCARCDAGSGLKIKSSCTTTSDSICEPLEGFYCMDSTENGCRAAQRHTRCQPGQYISQKGTASTDTVCSDCNDGTFSNGTFTSCQPHTQCEAQSLLLITAGTASTDAKCGERSSYLKAVIIVLVFVFLFNGIGVTVYYFVRKKKRRQTNLKDRNGRERVPTKEPGGEAAMKTLC